VVQHNPELGEEDWVHRSAPIVLADGFEAVLLMSTDPLTGERDGPYVLVGTTEYTLEEAAALGVAISRIAEAGTHDG
jgi:hypothetical protein